MGAVAVLLGITAAYTLRWSCDDAFISFRYARQLVDGNGLVFNPGERVEGYTNPAWTLWIAAGLALGVPALTWAHAGSITAFAGLIVALVLLTRRVRSTPARIPIAALVMAAHPDALELGPRRDRGGVAVVSGISRERVRRRRGLARDFRRRPARAGVAPRAGALGQARFIRARLLGVDAHARTAATSSGARPRRVTTRRLKIPAVRQK